MPESDLHPASRSLKQPEILRLREFARAPQVRGDDRGTDNIGRAGFPLRCKGAILMGTINVSSKHAIAEAAECRCLLTNVRSPPIPIWRARLVEKEAWRKTRRSM